MPQNLAIKGTLTALVTSKQNPQDTSYLSHLSTTTFHESLKNKTKNLESTMATLPETRHEAETLPDAWDYKGRPSLRSSSGGWMSSAMILGLITSRIL